MRRGNGNGTFKAAVSYRTEGTWSRALILCDLDNNGVPDLITAGDSGGQGYATVRLGNGDGTYRASTSYKMGSGQQGGLSAADLNADGILDIVTAGLAYASVRLGNGDGSFKAVSSYQTEGGPVVALGDIDRNGTIDLMTAGAGSTVRLGTEARIITMSQLNLLTQGKARNALDTLKDALTRITSELGVLGSFQRRLDAAGDVLQVARESFLAAHARIEDADMAEESASLIKSRLLQDAATAVLAHANQAPSLALTLLTGS